jgi:hypothetical protein
MQQQLKDLRVAEQHVDDLCRPLAAQDGPVDLDRERAYTIACNLHYVLGPFNPRSVKSQESL